MEQSSDRVRSLVKQTLCRRFGELCRFAVSLVLFLNSSLSVGSERQSATLVDENSSIARLIIEPDVERSLKVDLGVFETNTPIEIQITLLNCSGQDLFLESASTSCGCLVASTSLRELPVNAELQLLLKMSASTKETSFARSVKLVFISPSEERFEKEVELNGSYQNLATFQTALISLERSIASEEDGVLKWEKVLTVSEKLSRVELIFETSDQEIEAQVKQLSLQEAEIPNLVGVKRSVVFSTGAKEFQHGKSTKLIVYSSGELGKTVIGEVDLVLTNRSGIKIFPQRIVSLKGGSGLYSGSFKLVGKQLADSRDFQMTLNAQGGVINVSTKELRPTVIEISFIASDLRAGVNEFRGEFSYICKQDDRVTIPISVDVFVP